MTKNIIVVDSQGKKYGTTYLKRAKGLIKQGRARFAAPNMLCLACPPNQNLEDYIMSEQTIDNITVETEPNAAEDSAAENKYSPAEYHMFLKSLLCFAFLFFSPEISHFSPFGNFPINAFPPVRYPGVLVAGILYLLLIVQRKLSLALSEEIRNGPPAFSIILLSS